MSKLPTFEDFEKDHYLIENELIVSVEKGPYGYFVRFDGGMAAGWSEHEARQWAKDLVQRYNDAEKGGNDHDVCGFCGEIGADKIPHPIHWPGEKSPGSDFVHSECEQEETARAHNLLSQEHRESFLRAI